MLLNPSMFFSRLQIWKSKQTVYDERFHKGVNIIRGENGSGKSTIIEAIIYLLGGDIKVKKGEFKICDFVMAEIEVSGKKYTFKRFVDEGLPPIDIFEGNLDEALSSTIGWERYSNRRTDTRLSYSQMIFLILGIPEDKSSGDSNITINDLLRLIYEDQASSSQKIFLSVSHPEAEAKKQAISDLMLGIDEFELLNLKTDLKSKEKDYSNYEGQLRQIYSVLGSAEFETSIDKINAERQRLVDERTATEETISHLYSNQTKFDSKEHELFAKNLRVELSNLKERMSDLEQNKASLQLEIEDSEEFIVSLEARLEAINISVTVTSEFGGIDFHHCPSCYKPLSQEADPSHCPLCKSEFDTEGGDIALGILKLRNEIAFQLNESRSIVAMKKEIIKKIETDLAKVILEYQSATRRNENIISYLNPLEAQSKNLITRLGYIDRALEDLENKVELANKLKELSDFKASLNEEISTLKDRIEAENHKREKRKGEVYTRLNDLTVSMLAVDPKPELSQVERIEFDFGKDKLIAVGKSSPAASTGVFLKNSFFFSMLLISLEKKFVRYPRFIIMDNIEDKGMETERVQALHSEIINRSEQSDVVHQIIFTARSEVMSDDLEGSEYCVGKNYKAEKGQYSLKLL